MYGMYCLVVFFTTIIATYGSFSEILDHGATFKEVGLFVIVFYCLSLLYIICNEAHYASQKVGLDFQTQLLNINLTAVDTSTQREVEMFLVAIAKNPPTMNLDGYATINRELITTVSVIDTERNKISLSIYSPKRYAGIYALHRSVDLCPSSCLTTLFGTFSKNFNFLEY